MTFHIRPVLVILGVFVALLAACNSDDTTVAATAERGGPTAIPAPAGVDAAGDPVTLEVVDGGPATGLVITNFEGAPVYGAIGETADNLICLDDCLQSWIPVAPRAGSVTDRLDAGAYGAINRADGIAQATYLGIPLYTWTGDSAVGVTQGAGVAGIWYALTEQGGFVTPESP